MAGGWFNVDIRLVLSTLHVRPEQQFGRDTGLPVTASLHLGY
jgi:hypothetical protein